ncbi:response regulator [Emticicia sp. CRIBPO]|jgi:two-component system response regulator HydG|uniref:sigma-54-dependent transcriptional regulator n=1 Tax=Emticicia sp. CRIBPO TaxID=2683258 RepID=UPI0014133954|nr:sigma-54 dependent transcriptional regulator [Emticicia sp. CRIBPO]NBA85773.1 response regulator [Emticicia sp. CRIBPO]
MSKLLIIDDDVDVLSAAKLFLKRHFGQVDIEKNPEKIPFLITNGNYDVVLLDMNFTRDVNTGKEGFQWLDRILDIDPLIAVVLFTAYGDVEMAVRAIKMGAVDFVLKPWDNVKLLETMNSAFEIRQQRTGKTVKTEQSKEKSKTQVIGKSQPMLKIFETVERVASTDANILILGENGTGKDLIARILHENSDRANMPFVHADLGSISESLFESELFGHVKGAFTDAREERTGRFEEANGGTIFLDEIGNIPLSLQAKLLNVLQNRSVTKVGSNKPKNIDIRLICATNEPIYDRVNQKTFRQDLLYRINTIEVKLPPLRERTEDIALLAEHFLKIYRKKYNRPANAISGSLLKQLQRYHWSGNVRELQHAIERAVILSQGNTLQVEDFHFNEADNFRETDQNSAFENTYQLEEMEKSMILKALKKYNGNITEVSRELGLSRPAVYRRIEKYGL